MVPLLPLSVAGIFASENLRSLAVIAVIAVTVDGVGEPCLIALEMLIVEINLHLLHLWLEHAELVAL